MHGGRKCITPSYKYQGRLMARRTRATFLLVAVVFAIYVLWSGGGLVILSTKDFRARQQIALAGLDHHIWLQPTAKESSVPPFFRYVRSGEPFAIRVEITDRNGRYESAEIAEVLVEYKDGKISKTHSSWSGDFRPYPKYRTAMLSGTLPNVIDRHSDLKITLTGYLITMDGDRVAFRVSQDLEAESTVHTTTFWHMIAGC
jgi:hypothetical protein